MAEVTNLEPLIASGLVHNGNPITNLVINGKVPKGVIKDGVIIWPCGVPLYSVYLDDSTVPVTLRGRKTDPNCIALSNYIYEQSNKKYRIETLPGITPTGHFSWCNFYTADNGRGMVIPDSKVTDINMLGFNTSGLTRLNDAFSFVYNLTNLQINSWDVSNVTTMNRMFYNSKNLVNINLANWNTSSVTDLSYFFALSNRIKNVNLNNWNTSKVTNTSYMFYATNFDDYSFITKLNLRGVKNASSMLRDVDAKQINVSNLNLCNATVADHLLSYGAYNVLSIEANNLNLHSATNIEELVYGCYSVENVNLVNLDISGVKTFPDSSRRIFGDCMNLEFVNLHNCNLCNCTTIPYSFERLFASNLDMSNAKTDSLESIIGAFRETSLDVLNLDNWNTSNLTDIYDAFYWSRGLRSISFNGWNTSKITNMGSLFSDCYSLDNLNIFNWDVSNVIDMSNMFSNCYNLINLDISEWKFNSKVSMNNTFRKCNNLSQDSMNIISHVIPSSSVLSASGGKLSYLGINTYDPGTAIRLTNDVKTNFINKNWVGETEWNFPSEPRNNSYYINISSYEYTELNWPSSNTDDNALTLKNWLNTRAESTGSDQFNYSSTLKIVAKNSPNGSLSGLFTNSRGYQTSLKYFDYIDFTEFNMAKVNSLSGLFNGAGGVMDIKVGNTNMVTNMSRMFYGVNIEKDTYELDISYHNATDRTEMFRIFNVNTLIPGNMQSRSTVTSMSEMFAGTRVNYIDFNGVGPFSAVSMYRMFGSSSAKEIRNPNWNLLTGSTPPENMMRMFEDCDELENLYLRYLPTQKVNSFEGMFFNCKNIVNLQYIQTLNTSSLTDASNMFVKCSSLTELNLANYGGGWSGSMLSLTCGMFNSCTNIKTINLAGWNTKKLTSTYDMFNGCFNLTNLNLSGWNTVNVTNMSWMFDRCTNLSNIQVSGWQLTNVTNLEGIFHDCNSLSSATINDIANVLPTYPGKLTGANNSMEYLGFNLANTQLNANFSSAARTKLRGKNWNI